MRKFKFSYDRENDDLLVFNHHSKSKGSIELGDIIIDFGQKKEIVGLQLMNASKLIKQLTSGKSLPEIKIILSNLRECKVDIKVSNKLAMIRLCLSDGTNEMSPLISVPAIQNTSPALAYA